MKIIIKLWLNFLGRRNINRCWSEVGGTSSCYQRIWS